jgi:hypothetical protein
VLWIATLISPLIWFDGNAFTTWSVIVRILILLTALGTLRSWYRHPKLSKRAANQAGTPRRLGGRLATTDGTSNAHD